MVCAPNPRATPTTPALASSGAMFASSWPSAIRIASTQITTMRAVDSAPVSVVARWRFSSCVMLAVPSSLFRNRFTISRETSVTRTAAPKMMTIRTQGSASQSRHVLRGLRDQGHGPQCNRAGRPSSTTRGSGRAAGVRVDRFEHAGGRLQHEALPHVGQLLLGHAFDRRDRLTAVLPERIGRLAVFGDVDTRVLRLRGHPEPDETIDELQDHPGGDERERQRDPGCGPLPPDLCATLRRRRPG